MRSPQSQVGPTQVAVVVLQYLISNGFERSSKAFRKDAKELLAPVKGLPAGVRPLGAIISEYIALKEAQQRRAQLLEGNAALHEVFDVIERHAGGSDGAQQAQPAAYAAAHAAPAAPAAAEDAFHATGSSMQQATGSPSQDQYIHNGKTVNPWNSQGVQQAASPEQQQPQQQAQVVSPRKALRKSVPKRKRAAAEQGAAQQQQLQLAEAAAPSGSFSELLNAPINQRALEHLLSGEWQGRFAEGLASCINSRMGGAALEAQQEALLQDEARRIADAATAAAGRTQVCDEAEMLSWMTSFTEDPGMAALLQPIVHEPAAQVEAQPAAAAEQDAGQGAAREDSRVEPVLAPERAAAPAPAWHEEQPISSLEAWAPSRSDAAAGDCGGAAQQPASVAQGVEEVEARTPDAGPGDEGSAQGEGVCSVVSRACLGGDHQEEPPGPGRAEAVEHAELGLGTGNSNASMSLNSLFSAMSSSAADQFLTTLSY